MPYDIPRFFSENSDILAFYFPLGVIGFWRWGTWTFKEFIALFYRPKKNDFSKAVSIITPVYNEDPKVFLDALESWKDNKPNEITAVIDHTDKACIKVFKNFKQEFPRANLIITKLPGKRPALALGIRKTKSDIVALVDSDTIWNKNVLRHALSPFVDPKIGGVGTRQNVMRPKTITQRIYDIQLDHRYADEMAFLAATKSPLTCLSGRTAFYRRKILLPLLDDLVNETFAGQKVISGEDKRLTYLVEKKGWKTTYQSSAQVFTHGVEDFPTFFSQKVRWGRNSWRADLRALREGWVFKHPFLAFHLIDRLIQPFTALVSPLYFFLSLLAGLWQIAFIILVWWHVSRAVKIFPHLKRRPQDILVLPAYVITSFIFGFAKIYALFTMSTQGWITRWDKTRLQKFSIFQKIPAYAATGVVTLFVGIVIANTNQYVFSSQSFSIATQQSLGLVRVESLAMAPHAVLGAATNSAQTKKISIYEVQEGDFLEAVAQKNNTTLQNLLTVNSVQLPSWSSIQVGQLLTVPNHPVRLPNSPDYNFQKKYFPYLQISYNEKVDTIVLDGRGNSVTLSTIRDKMGKKYIQEVKPGEWILKSNILVKNGVTLRLEREEVRWLKLESDKKYTWIQIDSGSLDVNGVKITSWNNAKNTVDTKTSDGRSFVLAKYGSIIRIRNAEFAFLGFDNQKGNDTFGVSASLPNGSKDKYILTGEISNSHFHNNYHGIGLHGVYGMEIVDNTISQNTTGIVLEDSSQNTVKNNRVIENKTGMSLQIAKENTIKNNKITKNSTVGVYLHEDSSQNSIEQNNFSNNAVAIRVRGSANTLSKNTVTENRTGILLSDTASNNTLMENSISQNRLFAVLNKTIPGNKNYVIGE